MLKWAAAALALITGSAVASYFGFRPKQQRIEDLNKARETASKASDSVTSYFDKLFHTEKVETD